MPYQCWLLKMLVVSLYNAGRGWHLSCGCFESALLVSMHGVHAHILVFILLQDVACSVCAYRLYVCIGVMVIVLQLKPQPRVAAFPSRVQPELDQWQMHHSAATCWLLLLPPLVLSISDCGQVQGLAWQCRPACCACMCST